MDIIVDPTDDNVAIKGEETVFAVRMLPSGFTPTAEDWKNAPIVGYGNFTEDKGFSIS